MRDFTDACQRQAVRRRLATFDLIKTRFQTRSARRQARVFAPVYFEPGHTHQGAPGCKREIIG